MNTLFFLVAISPPREPITFTQFPQAGPYHARRLFFCHPPEEEDGRILFLCSLPFSSLFFSHSLLCSLIALPRNNPPPQFSSAYSVPEIGFRLRSIWTYPLVWPFLIVPGRQFSLPYQPLSPLFLQSPTERRQHLSLFLMSRLFGSLPPLPPPIYPSASFLEQGGDVCE